MSTNATKYANKSSEKIFDFNKNTECTEILNTGKHSLFDIKII